MASKKRILAINGSASENSANQSLINQLAWLFQNDFNLTTFNGLKLLPHFDPEQSANNPPASIIAFRESVEIADGVIICTPEYVFSIPSGLKNAIEWCVASTAFSDKPVGVITASAHGQKGHEELQMIMRTLTAKISGETALLVHGIKGKINNQGAITDSQLAADLQNFADAFKKFMNNEAM